MLRILILGEIEDVGDMITLDPLLFDDDDDLSLMGDIPQNHTKNDLVSRLYSFVTNCCSETTQMFEMG